MSDGTIEEIKARLNIVDLIGSYVHLEKSGVHYKACCPFHQERTPSFMVNEEKNMWHCFGCAKGGDVFAFVMEMEGLEFREALKMLAERAGVELPQYKGEEKNKETKDRIYELLELSTKFFEKQLEGEVGRKKIKSYLTERGLSEESIHTFRLGYAPDGWHYLLDFLVGRGFRMDEIEQAGLILKKEGGSGYYDRFRDRIMFPIFDILGRTIGYSARVSPGSDESQAKYINTPETAVYHKSRALYGLFQAKLAMKQSAVTVVVEGNMDVIAMHQAGIQNTIAVSGTAFTDEQLAVLKRYGKEVKLFFDMDGAGQKASLRSTELALLQEMKVSIVALPFGKDAADMGRENPEKLREVVSASIPALQYFLDASLKKYDASTADGKRKIAEEYAEILVFVRNPIEQSFWIKELARVIQMDEKIVLGVVSQTVNAKEKRERYTPFESKKETSSRQSTTTFSRRSELLREELIGFMYTDKQVKETILATVFNDETKSFLEKHPLYFFLVQSGGDDPIALIEDTALKNEAMRLPFHILELPDFINIPDEERSEKMLGIAKKYLEEMENEVTKKEKLLSLEHALEEARKHNDKVREKELLTQFTAISLDKFEKGC